MKGNRKIIKIDEEKCNGCGLCESACAEGAIKVIGGKARLVSESYCDGLGACLGECPEGAIGIEERPAEEFSEEAAKQHLGRLAEHPGESQRELPCGCPGSAVRSIKICEASTIPLQEEKLPSQLASWPVQLMLVPPTAPFLKGAALLVTADCVPFAVPDFHSRYLRGRVALVGCPKLDDIDYYREKLQAIIGRAKPRSITVLRMEVPCCAALAVAVVDARDSAAPDLPVEVHTIGIDGDITTETSSTPKVATLAGS